MMSPLLFLATCVAGGLGAALRFVVDDGLRAVVRTRFPVGTAVINISGSFALGIVTGLALGPLLPPEGATVLGAGLLGGYTTFSTTSVETVRLVMARQFWLAAANALGVLVAGALAALIGLWLGLGA